MILTNPIATGNTADIYLVEGKLIKLFKEYLPDGEAEYEANKQRYVYAHGLSVPFVYEVTKINGRQAIIMDYIPGETVGDIIFNDKTQAEYYMSLSVDVQMKIHSIKADDFELMTDKLNRQILSAPCLNKEQKNVLINKLNNMQKHENKLCHGDYHILNLILNDTDITIIDWVDASAGDIRADVCRSYLLYLLFSPELANLYIRLYCEKSGLSQEDIFEWTPIIAGAKLNERLDSVNENKLLEIIDQEIEEI